MTTIDQATARDSLATLASTAEATLTLVVETSLEAFASTVEFTLLPNSLAPEENLSA